MAARRPASPGALLLAPGAGSSSAHPCLEAVEAAVGLPTRRMDFPYRLAGRRAPDRAPVLLEAVRTAAAELVAEARVAPTRLLLGGRSMGGRMCSMAVADGLQALGLVLISYPLHPPGRPDKLRIDHLPQLDLPCLFVSGDRDPFGSRSELEAHTAAIPGPVSHVWLQGGHDLKGRDGEVAAAVVSWVGEQWPRGRPRGRPQG